MNVFGTRLNGEDLDITIAFCYYVIIKLPAEKAGNALGSVAEWFNALVTHKWTNSQFRGFESHRFRRRPAPRFREEYGK